MLDDYARKIDFIARANQELVKVDSLEVLLPRLLAIAEEAIAAEASSFLRYHPDSGALSFAVVRNQGADTPLVEQLQGKVLLQPGEGIAGRALQERATQLVHDVRTAEDFSPRIDNATRFTTRSILCVPVLHLDEPLGVIQVLNPRHREQFDHIDAKALEIFASLAAVAIARARHLQERLQQKELEAQVQMAAKIQRCCWPSIPELSHGSRVWGVSHPAAQVGGDLYDIIPLPDGSCLLYLADVSGKGLPAGFVMAALWSTIRSEARQGLGPAALLRRVNAVTFPFLSGEYFFATICMLQYWPQEGRAELALGGHHPPLLFDGRDYAPLPRLEGLPLGTVEDLEFGSHSFHLPRGGMLLLFSDGVTEAACQDGRCFGLPRLLELLQREGARHWQEPLLAALQAWSAPAPQTDDITLLALWRD